MKQPTGKDYLGRGLHSEKWKKAFREDGKLKGLFEEVCKDEDLVLQIRENYINIYYKGGNLVKVISENSFQFDCNYYRCKSGYDNDFKRRKEKRKEVLKRLKDTHDYKTFIADMKSLMNEYWLWLEKEKHRTLDEKDTQHALCINNTENTDYTIIDLEFQVSTHSDCSFRYERPYRPDGRYVDEEKTSPRFDIVAVRNSDHRLCVIELKSGINALKGKSGIGDHADSFEGSIGRNDKTSEAFQKEMLKVVCDKKKLKILNKDFYIDEKAKPEFIYAYAFTSDDNDCKGKERVALNNEILKAGCDKYKVIYLNKGEFTLSDNL